MNTFCLEKLSAHFKRNCLGETALQNHGSFEIGPKGKTQNDTTSQKRCYRC